MPKLNIKPNILERLKEKKRPNGTKRVMPKDKGQYLGSCNMSACLRPGANWYNHGSQKYYCAACAQMLSSDVFNKRESLDNWGHLLCTEGLYDREKFDKMHDLHNNAKLFLDTTVPKGTFGTYLPDENEVWERTREFVVREDTEKVQSELSVKFNDGTCEMIPMKKPRLSRRRINII